MKNTSTGRTGRRFSAASYNAVDVYTGALRYGDLVIGLDALVR